MNSLRELKIPLLKTIKVNYNKYTRLGKLIPTSKIVLKRSLAFLIDYGLILLYALILYGAIMFLYGILDIQLSVLYPIYGQIAGFFTLTLPVFLYFFLSERSKFQGTIGKRLMHIQVALNTPIGNRSKKVFHRNLFKFLPWEIAHTGVHWLIYTSENGIETPLWVWITLIFPQIIVVGYVVSIVTYGGKSSIYDKIAKTNIVLCEAQNSN